MAFRPHHKKKVHRIQRIADKKAQRDYAQQGKGLYVFRNIHKEASINLPKPAKDVNGKVITEVLPQGEFIGDDYFMMLVHQHECRLVRIIENPKKDGEIMQEEKLILDQPSIVKAEGVVEHVVKKPKEKKLNETPVDEPASDVLLNDDPLSGIEILG